MSRSAPLQFDITDIESSGLFLRTVYNEISMTTKHTRGCLPSGNDMPRLHPNLIKKRDLSENAWVGPPGCLPFFDGGIPRYFTNITKKVDVGSLSGSAPEIKL